ncbi:MAG: hypoxanthine phosphoribosyltransferase [Clostridia bacterium]|nr:hypoxanthine phosphoribosyltransferase [Clostridia bacterium]
MIRNDIERVLITEQELDKTVTRLAEEITRDYGRPDKNLVLLCILKGSIIFMSDLMKKLTIPVEIDCMRVSSYGSGTRSAGNVKIVLDLDRPDIKNCDLLIIEDIIDSGNTLSYLTEYLKLKGARSVKTCSLLDKPSRREVDFTPDYVGLEIPDEFVVGYGLDYAERYRTLPYVGILKPSVYLKR